MVGTHPIKSLRVQRGLTQEALGKELGVTGQTIWRWENRTRAPRRREVPRLAEKLGLSEAEVMGLSNSEAAA